MHAFRGTKPGIVNSLSKDFHDANTLHHAFILCNNQNVWYIRYVDVQIHAIVY